MSLEGRKYLLVFGFAFLWMILTVMALHAAGITSKLIEWTLFLCGYGVSELAARYVIRHL